MGEKAEKAEKEKKEAKEKDEKDAKEKASSITSSSTASIFDSYSPSTSSSSYLSSSSSLSSSIATPTLSNPTPSLSSMTSSTGSISDNYQKILDSIKSPTIAAATTAAATTTVYKSSSSLFAASVAAAPASSSSSNLDAAWEKLKAMTGVSGGLSTSAASAASSTSYTSTSSSLEALSAKAAASLSQPAAPSVGSIFENTYQDIMKQLKTNPKPATSGTVLGDIGGYNTRTSVLGINVPTAVSLSAQENTVIPHESTESASDKMFADSLAGLAKLGAMTDNMRKLGEEVAPRAEVLLQLAEDNESEDNAQEEENKKGFQMQLKQLTPPSGATVFVYEKVGEQDLTKSSSQDEEKEDAVPNSIHMLSGI